MLIIWLGSSKSEQVQLVGGKAANLGRLVSKYPVPAGFCLPPLRGVNGSFPDWVQTEIEAAYCQLGESCGVANPAVAVRSSALDEDGQRASFAGQHESYLNIVGTQALLEAMQRCLASAGTNQAQAYRRHWGLGQARVAVLVQSMVSADVSAVVFSADPTRGLHDRVLINATWGLGESLVSGVVTPDLYIVSKADWHLIETQIVPKACMTVTTCTGTRTVPVPRMLQSEAVLTREQIRSLTQLALHLEAEMGWPVDLECAFVSQDLHLLQCRPITTLKTTSRQPPHLPFSPRNPKETNLVL